VPSDKKGWIDVLKNMTGRKWNVDTACWEIPNVKYSYRQMKNFIGMQYLHFNFKIKNDIPEEYKCILPFIVPDNEEDVWVEKIKEEELKSNSKQKLQLNISPNPFNQITTIEYYLPEKSYINLTVTDLLGKPVNQPISWYSESGWFKKEFNGSHLSGNMYYLILQTENDIISKKILVIK